jgi:SEC-C motif
MSTGKIGRNDPCPCGSGKKYKKCCLDKDEAARRAALAAPVAPQRVAPLAKAAAKQTPSPGGRPQDKTPEPLSPEEQWWDDLYTELTTSRDGETRIALARRALAEGPPPESDVLLEVLAQAVISLGKAGRHAESMELLEAAAARFPEASRELEQYFERMRFESALERDDVDLVAEARRFGPHVHKVIGLVKDTPSHLAYEGKVDALRALTAAAWPGIVGDNGLMGWAVEEWGEHGTVAVVLEHLERTPDLSAQDPALLADLAPFLAAFEEDEEDEEPGAVQAYAQRWIELLEPRGAVTIDKGVVTTLGLEEDLAARGHIDALAAGVASTLRSREGWPRGRAWVAVRAMRSALERCVSTERKGRRKPPVDAILLPAPATFCLALSETTSSLFTRDEHALAAVLGLLPAWTEMLTAHDLVTKRQASEWLRGVMGTLRDKLDPSMKDDIVAAAPALRDTLGVAGGG